MQKEIVTSVHTILNSVEEGIKTTEKTIEATATPVRSSLIKKFPVLFLLVVTAGVVLILTGFERIVAQIPALYDRPWIMLGVGVGVLIATGTLYKKLG